MLSKLFRAETLELLENEINDFLSADSNDGGQGTIRIDATQQFTIGEVDRSALSLNGPQNVKYNFCIIIFYYYER